MKTPLKTLVAAALVVSAGSFATAESASAFVVKEKRVVPVHGQRGPIRDTMYRPWNPHGGYYPGRYYSVMPRYYPGMYWGGYNIYSRPIYAGTYVGCTWGRVMTPWGPRWRPFCV